jgi:nicotinamidase-related amidase
MKNEALLVVDMSNDFVADDGGLTVGQPAQQVVPYILEQADLFLKEGGHVVFTMDAHEKDDPHFELWPVHNVIGTVGQQLFGDLHQWYEKHAEGGAVHYVPKTNYNAFHRTNLAELLRENQIEKVHVVGVCTDICDFLTVAGADAEGFKTAVHKRGMATFTENGDLFTTHMKVCFHTEIID